MVKAEIVGRATELGGFMAGAVPLTNFTRLPGGGLNSSTFCESQPCIIVRSSANLSICTQLHGYQTHTRKVPHHELRNNGAFSPINTGHNSERKRRSTVRSEVIETAEAEQNVEVPNPTSTTATPGDVPVEIPTTLEVQGSLEKSHPYTHLHVGKRWREIQGGKRWKGLLDPLDPVLRGELIRYGEFTQATYDSFDMDTHSRFCGSCKYSETRFFQKMGLENRGYEVTDYIYSTAGEGVPFSQYFRYMDLVDEYGNEEKQNAWDRESNWMGYIAVTTDPDEIRRLGRRDISIVWRGTVTKLEWLEDLRLNAGPSGLDPRRAGQTGAVDLKLESGFLQIYKSANSKSPYTTKSARRQVLEAIERLVKKYGDEELSITVMGHSLGSALAMIAAYDIAETGVNQVSKLPGRIARWDEPDEERNPDQVVEWTKSRDVKTVPVTVYSFGGPRVGNDAFRDRVEELGVKVLRVVNNNDVVPRLPGLLVNHEVDFLERRARWFWRWLDSLPWTYSHVGVALHIDNMISPFLKKTRNPNNAHNLEGYMHVLSGFHGVHKPFDPVLFRDLALVNKNSDFLHQRHFIPASWWQEENKGLVRTEDGRWRPRLRENVDYPDYGLDNRDDAGKAVEAPPQEHSSIP